MQTLRQKTAAAAVVVTALSLGGLRPGFAADDDKDAKVPVSKAVLFSSGVGYFEHSGQVQGNAELRLMFKTDQINDVLKSMVLMDEKGGNATSVTYPSQEPIARALKSFGVDISGNPSLPELLQQLRGARVVVKAPEPIEGNILSVDKSVKVVGTPPTEITEWSITLVTDKGIRTLKLDTIQSITFVDDKLQQELNQALTLLVASRDKDRKPVVISFTGEGKRDVRVGYLVETPIWKTSYRLDLSGQKPMLQGWAIVENTSDVDWKNVALTLVSGRPISFIQDLYTPLYLPRPIVQPELYASLVPRRYEEGIAADGAVAELQQQNRRQAGLRNEAEKSANGLADAKAAAAMPPGAPAMAQAAFGKAAADRVALGGSVRSVASASDLGELFEFTIQHPVDLDRRRSAMLPIVTENVAAEKLSIYNQSQLAGHPLNGVELVNDTKLKLMAGPVTVFDDGAYAGDAQVPNMTPGEKRLLSYAVDLAVTVDPSQSNNSQMTSVKIIRGVIEVAYLHSYTQTYLIKNKAKTKRTLIIEHPFINGRDLIEPKAADEKTPQYYRFRVPIEKDSTGKFDVKEQQVQVQGIGIFDQPIDQIVYWIKMDKVDPKVKEALEKAVQMKQALAQLENTLNDQVRQLNEIQGGQERLRKNIETAGKDSQLGQRYLKKLSEEEDAIEKLNASTADLRKQIEAARNQLAQYLQNLSVGG
jgi:hypothetical protein